MEGIKVKDLPEDNLVETLFVLNKVSFITDSRVLAQCQNLPKKQKHIRNKPKTKQNKNNNNNNKTTKEDNEQN